MTKLAAIICVRMSSSRLPGKALCVYDEHSGKPNLLCLIDRIRASRHSPQIIVATTTGADDDPIIGQCVKHSIPYYRGDLRNVVRRFDESLRLVPEFDYVWRVMADNPLIDIGLVDHRIDTLIRYKADVVAPIPPEPTYAAHSNVWSREAWEYCAKQSSGSLLEHPGEFIYENAGMFKTIYDPGPSNEYYLPIRTELDTSEDLRFFRKVWSKYPYAAMETRVNSIYRVDEIRRVDTGGVLRWLPSRPDIISINSSVQAKTSTTFAHGHARARSWICKGCGHTIAHKVNEGLAINCQRCGEERRFYP